MTNKAKKAIIPIIIKMNLALRNIVPQRIPVRNVALVSYFVVAFLLFLIFLFPFDRIKTKLEAEVRERTPLDLKISKITPTFLNRFTLHQVVLSDKAGTVLFEAPAVHTKISILRLIFGTLSVDLKGSVYGGELMIKTHQGSGGQFLLVNADAIDIGAYPLLSSSGLRVTGKLGGDFELNGNVGKGRISVTGLAWRGLKLNGMSIPDQDFDRGWLEADVKGDQLRIKRLEMEGKEIKIKAVGDLMLRKQGLLNLRVKLKPSERLAREYKGMLGLLKNQDPDGFYQVTIGGTITSPMPTF